MDSTIDPSLPIKDVYVVTERQGARAYWTKIGTAWTNRDGTVSVRLDALPVNGAMVIRDREVKKERTP